MTQSAGHAVFTCCQVNAAMAEASKTKSANARRCNCAHFAKKYGKAESTESEKVDIKSDLNTSRLTFCVESNT